MQDIMSSIAPLGFERFSPLVNPLVAGLTPPPGPIPVDKGVQPTAAAAGIRLENKDAGASRPGSRHMAVTSVERKISKSVRSVPNGMALFSSADASLLLEAQAGRES